LHVTVEYNASSKEFFFAPIFAEFPSLEQSLLDDFKIYKATGVLPDYFGRDTDYSRPEDIIGSGLKHIHLILGEEKFKEPKNSKGEDALTRQWNRTSDACLLYVQNIYNEHSYSLIALFHPGAHMKAQDYDRMRKLASYARAFQDDI